MNYETQYLTLCQKLLDEGQWVTNDRTGRKCLTLIGESMRYDGSSSTPPLLTTKQSFPVSAVAEIIGYLRKYTNAQQFSDMGSPTWFVNANETQAWLNNPNRKGENDIGLCYGTVVPDNEWHDLFNKLRNHNDDRGLTIDFWRPELFDRAALRPCMRKHTFSIVGDGLYLTSESRSVDVACGLNFNSIQCYFLLNVVAKIIGLKPMYVTHNLINVHIYDSHIDGIKEQLSRTPIDIKPEFKISDWVDDFADITEQDCHAREYFELTGYEHLGKIAFDLVA
jgi:thymidylate synthase